MPRKKLDNFHYHEALDRTDMINNIISDNLISHPIFKLKSNKDILNKIEKAQENLVEAYQMIGNRY